VRVEMGVGVGVGESIYTTVPYREADPTDQEYDPSLVVFCFIDNCVDFVHIRLSILKRDNLISLHDGVTARRWDKIRNYGAVDSKIPDMRLWTNERREPTHCAV
jgi:hypothetical protein